MVYQSSVVSLFKAWKWTWMRFSMKRRWLGLSIALRLSMSSDTPYVLVGSDARKER